jgi:hypothetical protein
MRSLTSRERQRGLIAWPSQRLGCLAVPCWDWLSVSYGSGLDLQCRKYVARLAGSAIALPVTCNAPSRFVTSNDLQEWPSVHGRAIDHQP